MQRIRNIGVLTSGGDAPGMNAAIRAVVRTAISQGIKVKGILRGYRGLIEDDVKEMDSYSVCDIINRGGTILGTARSSRFMTDEGRRDAYEIYKKNNLEALVIIGGDGSYRGALEFQKLGAKVICIPGSIDLDIASTEYTIGFDTATNTVIDAIDKIRDTSTSHERCSIIEVMGRNAGHIALWSGISTGAEEIIIPEKKVENFMDSVATRMMIAKKKGKKHYIIINAEGVGNSIELAKFIEEKTNIETRATILGYVQRGGSPSCRDRMFASIMGAKAVETIEEGRFNRVMALQNGHFVDIDLEEAVHMQKGIEEDYFRISKELIR
ncbi:MAG: 6-phosphofructokinase [Eubacteriales bacterium]|nr:6-phosphofructokinase [Eubacteriales bacterium]